MTHEGEVWRFVPKGADPFHIDFLIRAGGRWNRKGVFGCFYTAPAPEAAVAEYRKLLVRRGFDNPVDLVSFDVRVEDVFDLASAIGFPTKINTTPVAPRGVGVEWTPATVAKRKANLGDKLGSIRLAHLVGNAEGDLDECRSVAQRLRKSGYLGLLAPSAAEVGLVTLEIYPENDPRRLRYGPQVKRRLPINYGSERLADEQGGILSERWEEAFSP